ncbi:GT4 family glycosyltransferase PelF [Pseudofulvibacter geojedonensis]|uniref:GT4 family glycosyltransferase PelF n=1 Tax=Pseudofulvibacter geojedonensis TaxID=1123758 RepID=A0ABW3HXW6_9FLAO
MENKKRKVLLILEGTYPFSGGGVSTWAHMLCNQVSNASYTLYSINANHETKYKYELQNIDQVIQVPIWAPQEPREYINYSSCSYSSFIIKKESTSNRAIKKQFLPLFKSLLYIIYQNKKSSLQLFDLTLYNMWLFFKKYDYKATMQNEFVWETYCETIKKINSHYKDEISIQDLTIGLRWIYRFIMPISIDVPQVDIAHVTLAGFPIIPALVAQYKYKVPIVITEHGVFIRERLLAINGSAYSYFLKKLLIQFSERITQLSYYKAAKILPVNAFNMKWEKKYGAEQFKLKTIYNGIDHLKFIPRKKPAYLMNTPIVIAAARIFELKDLKTMIRSCSEVKKVIPNVRYIVYGNKNAVPEYTKQCEQLIEELNVSKNFILAGFHSNPHMLYAEGDISILTSISEGFPYTVLEAMSCGLPVVATDVGGVSEAMNSSCGFICKPKDYKAIANKVITLLQNKGLRKQMGLNARKRIEENFTINNFISAYEAVYNEVIQQQNRDVQSLYKNVVKEAS